jgi:hypothetical protein
MVATPKSYTKSSTAFKKLKKIGVKVPPVRLTHVLVGKRKRVALVMPRYKYHSRDICLEDYVNKNMLKCLEDLYFKFKKAQVCSYDMQFVWNTTDKVLLTDPGSFSGHVKDENNESLWEIANFINIFRKRFKFKTLIPKEILDKSDENSYGDLG